MLGETTGAGPWYQKGTSEFQTEVEKNQGGEILESNG